MLPLLWLAFTAPPMTLDIVSTPVIEPVVVQRLLAPLCGDHDYFERGRNRRSVLRHDQSRYDERRECGVAGEDGRDGARQLAIALHHQIPQ